MQISMGTSLKQQLSLLALILGFLMPISKAQPQSSEILNHEITDKGEVFEISLGAADSALKTINLWFLSKGNDTGSFNSYIEGPAGLKVSIKSKLVRNKALASAALTTPRGFWDVKLRSGSSQKTKSNFVIQPTGAATNPFGGGFDLCSMLPLDQIKELLAFYSLIYGRNVTKEEICGSGGTDPDPGSDPDNPFGQYAQGLQLNGVFHKDACRSQKNSLYIVKMELDLRAIDAALIQAGTSIKAGMAIRPYRGETASSIKPVSDGKFAPKPLLLMSSLGSGFFFGSGGEKVEIRRWGSNGPSRKTSNLKVYDYVFYKGLVLTRSPLSGLSGGKATFTLTNGSKGYGACFALERRRQRWGGYP